MEIKRALKEATSFLREKGVTSPRFEAELLLSFLLGKSRAYLYSRGGEELTLPLLGNYRMLLDRRGKGEPIAYITGEKEFMGLSFYVNNTVFIPRPETEHLVEAVLEWTKGPRVLLKGEKELKILDLGTGCGNIAISLACYLPEARLVAVDVSEEALQVARENARRHVVTERIEFFYGSYWGPLTPGMDRFNVVVSNPPYIKEEEMVSLSREVKWEPPLALNGGRDGLKAYREIFRRIKEFIAVPGFLAVEIGAGQAAAVISLGQTLGLEGNWKVKKDYAGLERIVTLEIE